MIDRTEGQIVFYCDGCGDEFYESGTSEFNEAWADASAEGWTARKTNNGWTHKCPSCNE